MNEQVTTTTAGGLTGGDWVMAVISFFLTPLIPLLLSIYNFAKSRRSQGLLYLWLVISSGCFMASLAIVPNSAYMDSPSTARA